MDPTQYGRYELVKRLAAGGMAQVWLARQSGLEGFEKLLVVKQVLPHLAGTPEFVTMFLDEARLAAKLTHPNVVQVFDLGREEDENGEETLYIAMEYVHGEDLRRLDRASRKARNPIPLPLVCRIIGDAAAGLHYAHSLSTGDGRPLGIVHRDVSPQNVLVTFDGGVKVVDFGIAKAADRASKTRSGVLKGKYAYMSPEQASGQELDARSDVFALGIMLFELITGQRLFKRKSEILTLHAVVRCDVPRPKDLNPIIPDELDQICRAALVKDPEDRFASAEAFQLALEDFLVHLGEPASSAHLAAYVRDVFADRLQQEVDEGGPVAYLSRRTLTSSRSIGLAGGTPSGTRSGTRYQREGDSRVEPDPSVAVTASVSGQGQGVTTSGPPPPPVEAELEPGSASRVVQGLTARKNLTLGAAALVLGLSAFGIGLAVFGRSSETPDDPPSALAAVVPGRGDPAAADPVPAPPADPDPAPPADPLPAPDPDPAPAVEADPVEPGPDPEGAAVEEPKAPTRGRLQLALSPARTRAEIRVGKGWRKLSSGQSLPPGTHSVRLTLPDGSTHEESVKIVAGRTATLQRSFEPGSVRVLITRPFGAGGTVKVRGRKVGVIPGPAIELYPGTHTLSVVSEDGSKTVTKKVTVKAGKEESIAVVFD
ncbi:MAG: serine/threonine-protein kinase [Deltaproteobacteria bacterium]|nr:serine/threonine-protein kinase [Deltaproteobacteria bacterium]